MFKINESSAASVVEKHEKDKRTTILTEKAFLNKIKIIQSRWKKHVNKMKTVILALMKDDKNCSQVGCVVTPA